MCTRLYVGKHFHFHFSWRNTNQYNYWAILYLTFWKLLFSKAFRPLHLLIVNAGGLGSNFSIPSTTRVIILPFYSSHSSMWRGISLRLWTEFPQQLIMSCISSRVIQNELCPSKFHMVKLYGFYITVFGDRAFREKNKVKWYYKGEVPCEDNEKPRPLLEVSPETYPHGTLILDF